MSVADPDPEALRRLTAGLQEEMLLAVRSAMQGAADACAEVCTQRLMAMQKEYSLQLRVRSGEFSETTVVAQEKKKQSSASAAGPAEDGAAAVGKTDGVGLAGQVSERQLLFVGVGRVGDSTILASFLPATSAPLPPDTSEHRKDVECVLKSVLAAARQKLGPSEQLRLQWNDGSVCCLTDANRELLYCVITSDLKYPERLAYDMLRDFMKIADKARRDSDIDIVTAQENELTSLVGPDVHALMEKGEDPRWWQSHTDAVPSQGLNAITKAVDGMFSAVWDELRTDSGPFRDTTGTSELPNCQPGALKGRASADFAFDPAFDMFDDMVCSGEFSDSPEVVEEKVEPPLAAGTSELPNREPEALKGRASSDFAFDPAFDTFDDMVCSGEFYEPPEVVEEKREQSLAATAEPGEDAAAAEKKTRGIGLAGQVSKRQLLFLGVGLVGGSTILASFSPDASVERELTNVFKRLLTAAGGKLGPSEQLRLQWNDGSVFCCMTDANKELLYCVVTSELEYPQRLAYGMVVDLMKFVGKAQRDPGFDLSETSRSLVQKNTLTSLIRSNMQLLFGNYEDFGDAAQRQSLRGAVLAADLASAPTLVRAPLPAADRSLAAAEVPVLAADPAPARINSATSSPAISVAPTAALDPALGASPVPPADPTPAPSSAATTAPTQTLATAVDPAILFLSYDLSDLA